MRRCHRPESRSTSCVSPSRPRWADAQGMYLVGARFGDAGSANHALGELRHRIAVAPDDLGVRPLGSLRYERPAVGVVVAGRFELADVDSVVAIMERHGGEIVFR